MDLMAYSVAGERVAEVIRGINSVMNTDGFNLMMAIGATVGFIYFMMRWFMQSGKFATEGKTIIVIYVLVFGMLLPRTDLLVRDVLKGSVTVVGETSLGVSLLASGITQIGYQLNSAYAAALSNPVSQINPYSLDGGYLSPIQYIFLLKNLADGKNGVEENEFMKDLQKNLEQYTGSCYVYHQEKLSNSNMRMDFARAGDLWNHMLAPEPTRMITIESEGSKLVTSCPKAWEIIGSNLNSQAFQDSMLDFLLNQVNATQNLTNPAKSLGKSVPSQGAQRAALLDVMNSVVSGSSSGIINNEGVYEEVDTAGVDIVMMMRNLYIFRVTNQASKNYYSRKVGTSPFQATLYDGLMQKNLSMGNSAWSFSQYMTPIVGFIEALIYALLPVAIFLMLVTGASGLKTASMYLLAFYWVSLWPLSYAIIHYWLVSEFMTSVQSLATVGSLTQMSAVLQEAMNTLGAGGMWIGLVPVVTLFIVKGSMYTFNTIATQIQGSEHMNENVQHRNTFDAAPLHSFQGAMMLGSAQGGTARMGDGANTEAYNRPLVGQVAGSTTYDKAFADAQSAVSSTGTSYQKAKQSALSNALQSQDVTARNYGLKFANTESLSESDQKKYDHGKQAVINAMNSQGWNSSDTTQAVAMGKIAASLGISTDIFAAKFGLGAEASNSIQAAMSSATSEQKTAADSLVSSLLASETVERGINDMMVYSKDLAESESTSDTRQSSLGQTLSRTHDEAYQAQKSVSIMESQRNAVQDVYNMDRDMFYNGLARMQGPEGEQLMRRLSDPKISARAREIANNPSFYDTWDNAQFADGRFHSAELGGYSGSGLELAAKMEALKELDEGAYMQSVTDLVGSGRDREAQYNNNEHVQEVAGQTMPQGEIERQVKEANKGELFPVNTGNLAPNVKEQVEKNIATSKELFGGNGEEIYNDLSKMLNEEYRDDEIHKRINQMKEDVANKGTFEAAEDEMIRNRLVNFASSNAMHNDEARSKLEAFLEAGEKISEKHQSGETPSNEDYANYLDTKDAAAGFLISKVVPNPPDLKDQHRSASTTQFSPEDLLEARLNDQVTSPEDKKAIEEKMAAIKDKIGTDGYDKYDAALDMKKLVVEAYPEYQDSLVYTADGSPDVEDSFSAVALAKDQDEEREEEITPLTEEELKAAGLNRGPNFKSHTFNQMKEHLASEKIIPDAVARTLASKLVDKDLDIVSGDNEKVFRDSVMQAWYENYKKDGGEDIVGFHNLSFAAQAEIIQEHGGSDLVTKAVNRDPNDEGKVFKEVYESLEGSVRDVEKSLQGDGSMSVAGFYGYLHTDKVSLQGDAAIIAKDFRGGKMVDVFSGLPQGAIEEQFNAIPEFQTRKGQPADNHFEQLKSLVKYGEGIYKFQQLTDNEKLEKVGLKESFLNFKHDKDMLHAALDSAYLANKGDNYVVGWLSMDPQQKARAYAEMFPDTYKDQPGYTSNFIPTPTGLVDKNGYDLLETVLRQTLGHPKSS